MKKNPRQDDIPGIEQLQSEILFISTFLRMEKRERWKDFLPSPKNRIKAVQTLDHFKDLDQRYLVAIPKDEQRPEKLAAKLRSL